MAKIKDKAKLFSMSYRRGSFTQAEGSSKWKHSAKNVFLCEAQFAHAMCCHSLLIRSGIEPASGRLELNLWYQKDIFCLNHSYNKPTEEYSLS